MTQPYDGLPVTLGGRTFSVPALTIRQLRQLAPKMELLAAMTGALQPQHLDAMVDIAHAAIARNHPEVTREELEDLIDLRNWGPLMSAITTASGLLQPGEATAGSRLPN